MTNAQIRQTRTAQLLGLKKIVGAMTVERIDAEISRRIKAASQPPTKG